LLGEPFVRVVPRPVGDDEDALVDHRLHYREYQSAIDHGPGCGCIVCDVRLHFGDPQIALGVTFAVIALLLGVAFTVIGLQAGTDVSVERVQRVGYWLRKRWLAFLAGLGVVWVGVSLFALPYPSGAAGGRAVVVVKGGQFFWSFSPPSVPVGSRVRFEVTSVDVNHGFGLYDPRGHLVGSVQAMPGYVNRLDLTLSEPGVYRVRCLEYCGLNHATMEANFLVSRS
jgi:cytochrome c oxidase subunit 2